MLDTPQTICRGNSLDIQPPTWWGEFWAFGKWLLGALVGLIAWFVKADRDGLYKAQAQAEARQTASDARIAALEASRPFRTELVDAVAEMRMEVRQSHSDLAERMDLLIDIKRGRRE